MEFTLPGASDDLSDQPSTSKSNWTSRRTSYTTHRITPFRHHIDHKKDHKISQFSNIPMASFRSRSGKIWVNQKGSRGENVAEIVPEHQLGDQKFRDRAHTDPTATKSRSQSNHHVITFDSDLAPSTSSAHPQKSSQSATDHSESDEEITIEPQQPQLTKKQKAILEFVQNVSIGGLSDTYKAVFLPEKIMWYCAYVIALIGIIRSCNDIAKQYASQTPGYGDVEIMNESAPFPNISICAPEAIDKPRALPKINVPSKIEEFIRSHGLNQKSIIDWVTEYSTLGSVKPKLPNGTVAYALAKIMSATFQSFSGGFPEFIRTLYPDCEKSLSDCEIDGKSFDCCKASRFVPFDNAICYHMTIPHSANINGDLRTTAMETEQALVRQGRNHTNTSLVNTGNPGSLSDSPGLVFNVTIDHNTTTSLDQISSDGFYIHIGSMVSVVSTPIGIPSGMDAIIVLGPAKKMVERTQCVPNDNAPQLQFFDYYDQYGTNCFANSIIEIFASVLGCAIPYLTLDSRNMTPCGTEAMGLFSMFLEIDDVRMSGNNAQSKLYASSVDARNLCQPLCTRWEYPVISASYAKIQYPYDHPQNESKYHSKTWSRIKIYFPSTSYRLHKEEPLNQAYFLVCNIGMTLSSYAGISMISFAEVLAYGLMIIFVLPVVIKMKTQLREKMKTWIGREESVQNG